jgi:hypothetical protein
MRNACAVPVITTEVENELDFSTAGTSMGKGSFVRVRERDRLEFESLLLHLRLCFLLAPLLLIAAYGMRAGLPALEVELVILAD